MQTSDDPKQPEAGTVKRVRFENEENPGISSIKSSIIEQSETNTRRPRSTLHVEAILHPGCPTPASTLRPEIEKFVHHLGTVTLMYQKGPLDVSAAPLILQQCCQQISIVEWDSPVIPSHTSPSSTTCNNTTEMDEYLDIHDVFVAKSPSIASWNVSTILVYVFTLSDEEAEMEDIDMEGDENEHLTACETLPLPHSSLHSLWDSIILPDPIKNNLLSYAQTALVFSDKLVSPHIITWNRVLLLHGPPGTGKTSLCRSLAHKLSIRLSDRFPAGGFLMEIHSHSLFSKWFSESGKLVHTLFQHIRQMIDNEPDGLFCLLVDEVESLATNRVGSSNGSGEPSDAIRAVNALLTSLDQLKRYKNVLVLTTTNITGSVDVAFVDRADMKQYIGLPCLSARYQILKECIVELIRVGLILSPRQRSVDIQDEDAQRGAATLQDSIDQEKKDDFPVDATDTSNKPSNLLYKAAMLSNGFSGRSLRRLPFQAHAFYVNSSQSIHLQSFLHALCDAIQNEKASLNKMMCSN